MIKEAHIMILYEFPITDRHRQDLVRYKKASLFPIHLTSEPYEAFIETQGLSFHIIFSSQANGNFLCIPNWQLGCELSDYSDKSRNRKSLLRSSSMLDYEDATAIAYGIELMQSEKLISLCN